jgi:hypothetical protein
MEFHGTSLEKSLKNWHLYMYQPIFFVCNCTIMYNFSSLCSHWVHILSPVKKYMRRGWEITRPLYSIELHWPTMQQSINEVTLGRKEFCWWIHAATQRLYSFCIPCTNLFPHQMTRIYFSTHMTWNLGCTHCEVWSF